MTVSLFGGKHMINIREYYEKDGDFLPGKKVWFFMFYFLQASFPSVWMFLLYISPIWYTKSLFLYRSFHYYYSNPNPPLPGSEAVASI